MEVVLSLMERREERRNEEQKFRRRYE